MSKNIKVIFFDFDGVLAESVNVKTEAFRKLYLPYGTSIAERVVAYHLAHGGVSRFEKIALFHRQWLNLPITDEELLQIAAQFSKLCLEGVVNAPEVKGAQAFLDSAEHYRKFIITGTPTDEIRQILQLRNMATYFEAAYGSPEKKEYWAGKILAEQRLNPAECVFIGDAMADYHAAKLHDIPFVLRETEENTPLFKDHTGYRIKDLDELNILLDRN